ncbi:MAG: DUF523 domain-containing protein [Clostridia bacterium]|nr:DUF523 domain-containing protein [Clostridia bacterium]MBQ9807213.1 DUF523 domain-containing protein [Clostridia bacterium]
MEAVLVSACLLGEHCRYDGESRPCAAVAALGARYRLIPVCPEVMGGLPTPRTPSEICGNRVMMRNGTDVTEHYRLGAEKALRVAKKQGCKVAILKERSPSCGKGTVYSGHFDGTLVEGNGICAALLLQNGIRVLGESEITAEGGLPI